MKNMETDETRLDFYIKTLAPSIKVYKAFLRPGVQKWRRDTMGQVQKSGLIIECSRYATELILQKTPLFLPTELLQSHINKAIIAAEVEQREKKSNFAKELRKNLLRDYIHLIGRELARNKQDRILELHDDGFPKIKSPEFVKEEFLNTDTRADAWIKLMKDSMTGYEIKLKNVIILGLIRMINDRIRSKLSQGEAMKIKQSVQIWRFQNETITYEFFINASKSLCAKLV